MVGTHFPDGVDELYFQVVALGFVRRSIGLERAVVLHLLRAREPGFAFVDALVLWAAIAATMIVFWQRSTIAGILFMPCLAWVSFASLLNFTIWRLNG